MDDRPNLDGGPLSTKGRLLVVDDDGAVRTALRVNLSKAGYEVLLATQAKDALATLRSGTVDALITDVRMPGASGIDLLRKVRQTWPDVPVIVMTGYSSVEDAVAAMKAGAADYIIKPVSRDEVLVIVERALEQRALKAKVAQLQQEVEHRFGFEQLIGTSAAMLSLYEDIAAVADTNATVLLQGPTGTGKELLAHALHYRSRRRDGPFVRVNCTAIPEALLESELFGHEQGAFTGAVRQHRGRFEQADGGTLFLDEIGEIDANMQTKLLRVLEAGEFQRVGGTPTLRTDVRVVTATNRDLKAEVAAGRFREDLFYRINVVTLRVPPLSARRDDIPLLVQHFIDKYAEANERPALPVSKATMQALCRHDWPGNVRQLEHAIERAVILHREGDTLQVPLLDESSSPAPSEPAAASLPEDGLSLSDALAEYEQRLIVAALDATDGVQAQAAKLLQMSRSNFNYRLHKLGIDLKRWDR